MSEVVRFHWGLAYSANVGEWAYTLLGVFTSIITILVLVKDWGDWKYQKEEARKQPGKNRGELIVALTEVIRCVLALMCQLIIVSLGVWAMFTPPPNGSATITPLGIGFAVGLSLLEIFLLMKALIMFIADRKLTIVSEEEAHILWVEGRDLDRRGGNNDSSN